MRVALIIVGILAGLAAVVLAFDRWMLWNERRRQQARLEREASGVPAAVATGAFGVGFEIWQPGYNNFVEEKQRQENWIEQSESGAPPRDVDLEKGVARIRMPKRPDAG